MAEDDDRIRHTKSTRCLDVFEVAPAQEFRPHQANERDPGKQEQYTEQHEESRYQNGRDDQQQIERRNRGPDLDEALEQKIGPAPEISLHGTSGDTDDRGNDGERQSEQDRNSETIDQARNDIATAVVGT